MRYLVIGDASSMHIYNFLKSFLIPAGYEIHLLTLSSKPVKKDYMEFYESNHVTVHSIAHKNYKVHGEEKRSGRLSNLMKKLRLMKDVPPVDVCHLQSVYKTAVMMVLLNRKKFKKLILSYWGTDLLERSKPIVRMTRKALDLADVVTVTVQYSVVKFKAVYGERYNDKLKISRFGTAGIDCIKKLSESTTREECRACYHIPEGKICVTCGYSASPEQHQELCLQEMMKLPEELRRRLFVIVPLQYGRTDEAYIARVHAEREKCDFDCVILEEYVPFEMSAKLAISTDVYLHVRDADAFSNALKEHVYSGSTIVCGTWLKYIELEQMKAPMIPVDSIENLHSILGELLPTVTPSRDFALFAPMYELYSTESICDQWRTVISLVTED